MTCGRTPQQILRDRAELPSASSAPDSCAHRRAWTHLTDKTGAGARGLAVRHAQPRTMHGRDLSGRRGGKPRRASAQRPATVRDVVRDVLGLLAIEQARPASGRAAGAALLDRVEDEAALRLPPLSVSRFGPTRPTAAEPASVWQVEHFSAKSWRPSAWAAVRSTPPAPCLAWFSPLETRTSSGTPMPTTRMTSAMPMSHARRCHATRARARGGPAAAHRREHDREADGKEDEDEHQGADHVRDPTR